MKNIVMIQPQEGIYNKVLKPWAPMSLLAAATDLDREGRRILVIDQRVDRDWRSLLVKALAEKPVCVGITSMTGSQILGALEASRIVKEHGGIPVVWGGAHATLFSLQTVNHPLVDIVVKGEGEATFYELVKRLESGASLRGLAGVCYKEDGRSIENEDRPFVNLDDYPDMPYHLVDLGHYLHRFFDEKDVVEVESSRGCPYACAFCYNTLYSKREWRALSAEHVVGRIKKLADAHSIRNFHFIDDGFFIDKRRVSDILKLIVDSGLKVRLGFQGVRVDTFGRLSDEDIELLYRAGGRFLQFGVESGSPRILELINKKIRVEQVTTLNRRLTRHPQIIPYYNFMCGFPTETREDLMMTTSLAWTLLSENKSAMISPFHHYKPYPGTPLGALAVDETYKIPDSLEEWGRCDWTQSIQRDKGKGILGLMKNIELVSILADRKLETQSDSILLPLLAKLYRPVARYRLRNNFYSLMPESFFIRQ
jgi:radical SAM superfamily enzyme YgiQ (UPF0313 family)